MNHQVLLRMLRRDTSPASAIIVELVDILLDSDNGCGSETGTGAGKSEMDSLLLVITDRRRYLTRVHTNADVR